MKEIAVVSGEGIGINKIDAYDSALDDMGLMNQNIVKYSSVIPKNVELKICDKVEKYDVGDPIAVVEARRFSYDSENNVGLMWGISQNGGFIVEGFGTSRDDCMESLYDIFERVRDRRDWDIQTQNHLVESINNQVKPQNTDVNNHVKCVCVSAIFGKLSYDSFGV